MSTVEQQASYLKALSEFRKLGDVYNVYKQMHEKFQRLDQVMHVVVLGAGPAIDEIAFLQKLTPNLTHFTAVDKNPEWSEELMKNIKENFSDEVELDFQLTTIQDWKGPKKPADLVLMFHCLYYFSEEERKEMYKNCFNKWLRPDGKLFVKSIKDKLNTKATHYLNDIYRETNRRLLVEASIIIEEIQSLGYSLEEEYEYVYYQDLEALNESVLSFIKFEAVPAFENDDVVKNAIKKLRDDGNQGYSSGSLFSFINKTK